MPVRGRISPGSTVLIEFSAPPDNPGASVVGSGWLGTDDRQLDASPLVPGASVTHQHTESGAQALRLHLDVPTGGGRIEVEVRANGSLIDSGSADSDQFWTYFVQ